APPVVVAPPPLPPAAAAPPPVPPEWVAHPHSDKHEYNTRTGELREVAPPAVVLNPPEAPATELAAPQPVVEEPKGDESKVGDEYDDYPADKLRAIAKQHGIEVKGLREKALRIAVRAGMQTRARQIELPGTAAPVPTTIVEAAAPLSPPVESEGLPEVRYATPTPKKRPRFTLLVDTVPAKTQGVVMTCTEAFGVSFQRIAQEHGVTDWRLVPHGHGGALVYQAVKQQICEDTSLDRSVVLVRRGTPEGDLLIDLLFEHALEVYEG
ncbi:MAG: hypothetical protein ACRCSL_16925, partial [Microbacterium sp.]